VKEAMLDLLSGVEALLGVNETALKQIPRLTESEE